MNLSTLASKYAEMSITLVVGTAKVQQCYDAARARWARPPNARVFISLRSCCERMGLDQFNGQGWRWVFSGFKKWRAHMESLDLHRYLLSSNQSKATRCAIGWAEMSIKCGVFLGGLRGCLAWFRQRRLGIVESGGGMSAPPPASPWAESRTPAEADSTKTAMLPLTAATPWALIELCCMWATRKPRQGGFVQHSHKASDALSALLEVVGGDIGASDVEVSMAPAWDIAWPRPQVPVQPRPLCVGAGGIVSLAAFFRATRTVRSPEGKGWWMSNAFQQLCRELGEKTSLRQLLLSSSEPSILRPFYLQVLWWVGSKLQALIIDILEGKKKAEGLQAKAKSMADCLDHPAEMDRRLALFVRSGREAAASYRNVSLATDKAAVRGLGSGAQGSIFVLGRPSQAILGVPQAGPYGSSSARVTS